MEHSVDDVVNRAGADGIVRRVTDHLAPRHVEQGDGIGLWREEHRGERLTALLDRPLSVRGRALDIDAVRDDTHEDVRSEP